MPRYRFSAEHKAYIKQCSCCKTITVGATTPEESLTIFSKTFSPSTAAGMADGLQSRCWICNSSKRRELGVDRRQLETMWEQQKGKCAICDKSISIARNADSAIHAHVDHDATTGEVRELLCGDCNRGIGLFHHDSWTLKRATSYIDRHTKVVPLRRRI